MLEVVVEAGTPGDPISGAGVAAAAGNALLDVETDFYSVLEMARAVTYVGGVSGTNTFVRGVELPVLPPREPPDNSSATATLTAAEFESITAAASASPLLALAVLAAAIAVF